MKTAITWVSRGIMFGLVAWQNKIVFDIVPTYEYELISAESAVQASQLSGEMALVGMTELSGLLVVIVFWVMWELTLKEIFNRKEKSNGSV